MTASQLAKAHVKDIPLHPEPFSPFHLDIAIITETAGFDPGERFEVGTEERMKRPTAMCEALIGSESTPATTTLFLLSTVASGT
ncbi:hypothetical protein FRC11_003928 [Ceratobasidium sp. 423]|nr:hypothetical protein FRC11_003928 [Ceratobasidium sp. 423]